MAWRNLRQLHRLSLFPKVLHSYSHMPASHPAMFVDGFRQVRLERRLALSETSGIEIGKEPMVKIPSPEGIAAPLSNQN